MLLPKHFISKKRTCTNLLTLFTIAVIIRNPFMIEIPLVLELCPPFSPKQKLTLGHGTCGAISKRREGFRLNQNVKNFDEMNRSL